MNGSETGSAMPVWYNLRPRAKTPSFKGASLVAPQQGNTITCKLRPVRPARETHAACARALAKRALRRIAALR